MYSVCLDRIKLILLLPSLLQQYNLERQVYAVTTPELSNLCDHHLFRSYPRFASSRFSLTCSVNVSLIQIHSWFGTHSMAFTLFLNCFILEINILSWVCIAQRKGITVSGAHGKAICLQWQCQHSFHRQLLFNMDLRSAIWFSEQFYSPI